VPDNLLGLLNTKYSWAHLLTNAKGENGLPVIDAFHKTLKPRVAYLKNTFSNGYSHLKNSLSPF